MSQQPHSNFESFVQSLSKLGGTVTADPNLREQFHTYGRQLQQFELSREELASAIRDDPGLVPVLGLVVGLSQEALKNTLRVRLGSAGWIDLARKRPEEVISLFDDEFNLIAQLADERTQNWEYGDILLERAGSRGRAGGAIGRGRALEDEVEAIVGPNGLDLPYKVRTHFIGTGGNRAPCDVAIPAGGDSALIAIAVKGFNSTGSKLTDAAREVESMANVRQPRQFIYAVVDGIGWRGRQSDLRRIFQLSQSRRIDGIFNLSSLGAFRLELRDAARRLGMIKV